MRSRGACPVVEVVGPPGAGKTTLLAAWRARDPQVLKISSYRSLRDLPTFVRAGMAVAPLAVRRGRGSSSGGRWLAWLTRLQASAGVLRRRAQAGVTVAVFDQGPLYMLVRLHEDKERGTASFERWRRRMVLQWAATLDLVLVLDAPDEVLVERIRGRVKPHVLKSGPDGSARSAVAAERVRYDAVIAELVGVSGVRVLRFDTCRTNVAAVVAAASAALGAAGSGATALFVVEEQPT